MQRADTLVAARERGHLDVAGDARGPADSRRAPPRAARCGSPAGCSASLLVIGLALIPMILPGNRVQLVTVIAIYALIGVSLVVLTGWAGQVSLGQMAFVGVRVGAGRHDGRRAGTSTPG